MYRNRNRTSQKKQWRYYSGKKKKHTLKTQVIYHPKSQQIIGIDIGFGREHDIHLAKRTTHRLHGIRYIMRDLGYYGLKEKGFNLLIPYKKQKKLDLTGVKKSFNKQLSNYRIKIEHINRLIKIFKITSSCYRNRRKRFGLRMNLIAGLVNWMNRAL